MALLGWLVAHHVVTVLVAVLTAGLSAAVLGQRRPTGSAYAWLLVLLFVPYLGIPLYVVFGGRKSRRRARSKSPLPEGVVGVASAHAHRIPETTARTVAWLDDGVAAYETFLREIRGAERSIHIVTFVVADDPTGCTLLEALAERAAAGVEVRLLLDDFLRFHAPRRLLRKLEAAGGEVRRFMPLFHLPFRGRGNLRNHRKIALFDGARAIVGGMNLADDYMGPLPSPTRWRDLSAVVTGDAVGPLGAIFDADWDFSGPPSPAARASVARVALLAQHEESRTPPPAPAPLRVVPSGPDAPNDAIYDAFLTAIFRAETRFWVATPYFVPDEPLTRALTVAAHRGVDVRIFVPPAPTTRSPTSLEARRSRARARGGARAAVPHDAAREGGPRGRVARRRRVGQLRHAEPVPRLRGGAVLLRTGRGRPAGALVRRDPGVVRRRAAGGGLGPDEGRVGRAAAGAAPLKRQPGGVCWPDVACPPHDCHAPRPCSRRDGRL